MIVGVASCAHYAWIESSKIMGQNLANAIGNCTETRVHTPVNKSGLVACLAESNYFVMHTHGSPECFVDQRADGSQHTIANIHDVMAFPKFENLCLVVITACSAGAGSNNVAKALSTRIATNGLVIANRYEVWGASHDFGEKNGKSGWIAYQNGVQVLGENDIPASITMADAFEVWMKFRNS